MVWGDNNCQHKFDIPTTAMLGFNTLFRPEGENSTPLGLPSDIGKYAETVRGGADRQRREQVANFCSLCGAWRGAYGLEPTPEMYVEHTIEFLRAIRRVLRKDGVVFWNIGDSYAGNVSRASNGGRAGYGTPREGIFQRGSNISKPKDLCGIPADIEKSVKYPIAKCQYCHQETSLYFWAILNWHRFWCPKCEQEQGFPQIVEQGWWVRSIIIWNKPNPMPESARDRPTESHEYIIMLTKSAHYYWDMEAVREPSESEHWTHQLEVYRQKHLDIDVGMRPPEEGVKRFGTTTATRYNNPAGRNLRSVWTFATEPYPDAHFATFPKALPEKCILAATSEKGNCSKCGKPWVRITEQSDIIPLRGKSEAYQKSDSEELVKAACLQKAGWTPGIRDIETLGWQPQCQCGEQVQVTWRGGVPKNEDSKKQLLKFIEYMKKHSKMEVVPAVVLDPFAGSGTVGEVAKSLGRRCILIDTSAEYCSLAQRRIESISLPMGI